MTFKCDISIIMTAHAEGSLAWASIKSVEEAVEYASDKGISVEKIFAMDNPTDETAAIAYILKDKGWIVSEVSFKDQGKVRNDAVTRANGQYVAFIDADDLFCFGWLGDAYEFAESFDEDVIVHPEFNYFFEGVKNIVCFIDQDSTTFDYDRLRVANYWDSLSFCKKTIYLDFPFCDREIARGYAYEDWHWNCVTVAAGIKHKILYDSVIFKRRQETSQTVLASRAKVLIPPNAFTDYNQFEKFLQKQKEFG